MLIAAVILNYRCPAETIQCLKSIRAVRGVLINVWVVDNASLDDSEDVVLSQLNPLETWIQTGSNLGYAGGNNAGFREALKAGASHILVINPDCEVESGFLGPLLEVMERNPDAGVVCPMILDRETGKVQAFGGTGSLSSGRFHRAHHDSSPETFEHGTISETYFPPGACFLVRREVLEELGGFDENFFLYNEDVDFGIRTRKAGWKIFAVSHSRVRHRDSTSDGRKSPVVNYYATRNTQWVVKRHCSWLDITLSYFMAVVYFWPLKILARLILGYHRGAWAAFKGAIDSFKPVPNQRTSLK
ncbi:MAG: glycosyltransferase family 2 protein [Verrucomicrobiota bacterium]|nr:glycosyltransferase family 2 protein [Verrucomicrobiota bacterium]